MFNLQNKFKFAILCLSSIFCLTVASAQQKPSIAILDPISNSAVTALNKMTVIGTLEEYITNSGRYTVVERSRIEQILKEHSFARNGLVDNSQVKNIGKMLGADLVCVSELLKEDGAAGVRCSFINVETGEVKPSAFEFIEADTRIEIKKSMEIIAAKLLGTAISGAASPTAATQQRGTTRSVPANFVLINGGTFTMGSPASEAERFDNEIQHQVTVSSFYMGKYQVTQAEYQELIDTNPSQFKGYNLPVENVSWFDAVFYCNRLSQREGLTPAYAISGENVTWNRSANGYRLPTEAEWEYACRAGTTTPFSTGYNITTDQANYDGNIPYNNNAKGRYREQTTPVGSFAPNPWGLYDMHGNVFEWCWDWYERTYSVAPQTNPVGASSGALRVIRGGGWYDFGQSSVLRTGSATLRRSGTALLASVLSAPSTSRQGGMAGRIARDRSETEWSVGKGNEHGLLVTSYKLLE